MRLISSLPKSDDRLAPLSPVQKKQSQPGVEKQKNGLVLMNCREKRWFFKRVVKTAGAAMVPPLALPNFGGMENEVFE